VSYVDPFSCTMAVSDEELLLNPDAREWMLDHLSRQMVHSAHEYGYPYFDPTAVRVRQQEKPALFLTKFHMDWYPPEDRPVEFLGGPCDGDTEVIGDRMYYRVRAPFLPANSFSPQILYPIIETTYTYRRAGINPVTNRWVYILR
jgi:hypothetical protein